MNHCSFPINRKIKISKQTYIGDIIISYNFIDKPKSQKIVNFKEKLIKIFIHGFLHLLGFNHEKLKDFKIMKKKEINVLSKLSISSPYAIND